MRALMLPVMATFLVLTAGCLTWFEDRPDYDQIHADVERHAMPWLVQEHDHGNASLHAGSKNLDRVGYHNGFDGSGDPNSIPDGGAYTELAVTENYAYMARSGTGYGGFSILDIRNPADPFLLGHFNGLSGSDIEVNADETLAFFGTQRNSVEQIATGTMDSMDPNAALARGIYVVDIEDKRNPTLAGFYPIPYNGVHTLEYVQHPATGAEYIVVATYDLYANTVPSSTTGSPGAPSGVFPLTQRVIVMQITEGDQGAALLPVGQFQIPENSPDGRLYFPHDTFVQAHPVTGEAILYVAYWDKGVRMVTFDDPTAMTEISGFTEFAPSSRNNIHQVKAFTELIDGRHVTVAEPEIINADETGQITFLDTSDPLDPQKLSFWTQPNPDLFVQSLEFSPHNFDLANGLVALSHYHAGLWIIDVSDGENLLEPKTVAYTMDVPERANYGGMQPSFWTAQWSNGLVFAVDSGTGLHIYHYDRP